MHETQIKVFRAARAQPVDLFIRDERLSCDRAHPSTWTWTLREGHRACAPRTLSLATGKNLKYLAMSCFGSHAAGRDCYRNWHRIPLIDHTWLRFWRTGHDLKLEEIEKGHRAMNRRLNINLDRFKFRYQNETEIRVKKLLIF